MEPPAAVRTIGSLNALLGVTGIIAAAVLAAACVTAGWRGEWQLLGMTDAARFWAVAAGLVLLVLINSIAQLASGVGLLRLHGWGLSAARGYAWYSLLFAAVYGFLHFTLWFRPSLDRLTAGAAAMSRPAAIAVIVAAGIAGLLLMSVYPLLTLIALRGGALFDTLEAARRTVRADDRLALIPQFTLRRLLLLMGVSSIFFLVLGNAVAGRPWAIAISLGVASLVAAFAVYAATFFLVWILSLIWKPRSDKVAANMPPSSPLPPPPLSPHLPQSPFQPA